ncbi:MAG: ABC transporter ATP-binding protein [Gudongella sp.]|jgi:ABC-2 type transport system ATP-binding protein|nr:ABC transporter ATP-binding protein [Gudongella sp.]
MDDILKIENLSKSYDDFTLKNINFTIPQGAIMGLVGENGAGKTTTIKLILNLIKRDAGRIEIFGLDNVENEMEVKERIGVVLDESNFYIDLNPNDISKVMGNIYKNWDNNIFFSYLKQFNLPKNKTIRDLSKGMKMKLSIAIALSHQPDLLILDEPTSGLDPIVRNEILDIFLDFIQDEEKSILFSTHITSDLDKIADYISFIHGGELVLTENKDELINDYGIIKCGKEDFNKIDKDHMIGYRKNQFGYEILISNKENAQIKYKGLALDSVNLEDIMLFYIRGER